MTKYLIVLLLVHNLAINAQQHFFKMLPGWRSSQIFSINGSFSTIGLNGDSLFQHHLQTCRIDLFGNISDSLNIFVDTCSYTTMFDFSAYHDVDESYIAGAVIYYDTIADFYKRVSTLFYFNNDFTSLRRIRYFHDVSKSSMFFGMDRCGPYFYFIGQEKPADSVFSFVCKTDTLGNIKWKRRFRYEFPYYFGNAITKPIQIVRMSGEKHIVTFDSYTSDLDINKQYLACIDSSGNVLWEKNVKPELETYQCHLNISVINEEQVYLVWSDPLYKTLTFPYAQMNPDVSIYAVKMDISGNYIWEKKYRKYLPYSDTSWIYNNAIETDLDGDLLISLDYRVESLKSGLMKVRTNGNIKWIRVYDLFSENHASFQHTTIYDILPLGNDGYYMACEFMATPGNTFLNGIQTGLVIKTDKYGCLEPGCQWYDPTDFELNDGNDGEETGIECMGNDDGLRIWPNPVQDRLFVETPTLPAKIKMYNMNGELVKEILANQKVTEIGLGKLPKGIYLVQVVEEDGNMKTGKVVVE